MFVFMLAVCARKTTFTPSVSGSPNCILEVGYIQIHRAGAQSVGGVGMVHGCCGILERSGYRGYRGYQQSAYSSGSVLEHLG